MVIDAVEFKGTAFLVVGVQKESWFSYLEKHYQWAKHERGIDLKPFLPPDGVYLFLVAIIS